MKRVNLRHLQNQIKEQQSGHEVLTWRLVSWGYTLTETENISWIVLLLHRLRAPKALLAIRRRYSNTSLDAYLTLRIASLDAYKIREPTRFLRKNNQI